LYSTANSQRLELFAVNASKKLGRFDLSKIIVKSLRAHKIFLIPGDIVVVSSKFAAMAEGRYLKLNGVEPRSQALKLSRLYAIDPRLSQVILDESESILGGIPGYALAIANGILAPNGGIDRSNVPKGHVIMYPKNPQRTAERIRNDLLKQLNVGYSKSKVKDLGVVLSDSRITPVRRGTVGVAIAAAGFSPVLDFRGKTDLFGNELKVTFRAAADQLASAAQLLMGEASESIPIVVVRGARFLFSRNAKISSKLGMTISQNRCLYIQGLRHPFNPE